MAKGGKAKWPQLDDSVLAMEPDKIFESMSIDQIKDLIRGLQHETDRKREELRTLVGERYRDLMEAAETIICMRDTSSDVVSRIRAIQDATSTLSSLSHRMGDNKKKMDASCDFGDEAQYALAAQIKLLMDVPERMWNSVDSRDYLTATKLYLFARHIHTNLSLQEDVMTSYPVIDRQWAAISHFHEAISSGCEVVMSDGRSSVEDTVEAMVAVALLKGVSQKTIFEDFMKKRQVELTLKLKRQDVSAKAHINQSLASISSCLATVHASFIEAKLIQRLECLTEEKTAQLLNASVVSPVMDFLPSIIKDFRPQISG